jgi:hypothetical protein
MKFSFAGFLAALATGIAALSSAAQSTAPAPAPLQSGAQTTPQRSDGKVIFSRSIDDDGQTTTHVDIATAQSSVIKTEQPVATDPERLAVTFTGLDLDVRLRAVEQHIAVRALITVRNDSKMTLARIPLQISSTLQWERIRIASKDAAFSVATIKSDADHTGQLNEAAIQLARPLEPGAILQLDVSYSGDVPPSAQRLAVIDTPEDIALHSDWDQIGVSFTGLRGFGSVVWYPVSSVPAFLGEGARLFDQISLHKQRLRGAHFRLRLTTEFPHGQSPTVAVINGHSIPLTVTSPGKLDQGQEVAGVATADSGPSVLGFEAPSLFLAVRTAYPAANTTIWVVPDDSPAVPPWAAAATAVTPFLATWLGQTPRTQLTILDLPDPADAPFEAGGLLVAPIQDADPERLSAVMVHALTRAWLQSPELTLASGSPAWLDEGVAAFVGTLWAQKQYGHDQALGMLEAQRPALAIAEPASPGESAGQPLAQAISPIYYRTKAAYVLWMLRDMIGDTALSDVLQTWKRAQYSGLDSAGDSFQRLIVETEKSNGVGDDPSWIFSDWIDADKGLPDLTIESVFPTAQVDGNWLVAVHVANSGYASAEVPVTVRSADKSVTRRLLVPARGSAVQRILILGKPIEVQVNDGDVPETQASIHVTKLGEAGDSTSSSSQPVTPQQ